MDFTVIKGSKGMKIRHLLVATAISFMGLSTAFAANSGMSADTMKNDQAVLGWLTVLDKNEIAAADLTLKKSVNPSVKQYAKMLRAGHTKNLDKAMQLSEKLKVKPVQNETAQSLKQAGQQLMATLKPINGKAYQKQYIDGMVDGHTNALQQINSDMGMDMSPQVKNLLQMTQNEVQKHLDAGKQLQQQM
jgi:putative membrane protein